MRPASAIAERMLGSACKTLSEWDPDGFILRELPEEHGPGMALLLEARYEKSIAFAGPYLQDQLLLPFAIAEGGLFSTLKISQHTRTAAEIIKRFTGRKLKHPRMGHR